jgi:hypothetical protein
MNLLEAFGRDEDEVKWQDFGSCVGLDPQLFDETYKDNPALRPVVDEICLTCPVMKECYEAGTKNGESFVWGGTYLENGKPVPDLNDHKTDAVNNQMDKRLK